MSYMKISYSNAQWNVVYLYFVYSVRNNHKIERFDGYCADDLNYMSFMGTQIYVIRMGKISFDYFNIKKEWMEISQFGGYGI